MIANSTPTALATDSLQHLRILQQPTTEEFLRIFSGSHFQYLHDAPEKDISKALSTSVFDPQEANRKQEQGCGVYFPPNRFGDARRIEHLQTIEALFIDKDCAKEGDKVAKEIMEKRKSKALTQLLSFALRPHIIIETKNGLQAIWLLLSADSTAIDRFNEAEALLIRLLEADPAAKDVTRVLRLPGYFHLKDTQNPFLCQLLLYEAQRERYDLNAVLTSLRAISVFYDPIIESTGSTGNMMKQWQEAKDGVSAGGRNTAAASVIGRALTHLPEELWESIGWGGFKEWNSRNTPPLLESELRSIFKSIKSSEQRGRKKEVGKSTHDQPSRPVVVCLNDVVREDVQWLWKDRLPQGKFTIMEGDPSAGKSWLSLAIASAVTTGAPFPMDDTRRVPANVLLLNAEDAPADTIRPRMEGMEANLKRVHILTAVQDGQGKERHFSLDKDLAAIEAVLLLGGFSLLVIDPINAYLGSSIDANSDPGIRSVLTPLSKMAEVHRVAVIGIRHLTKTSRTRTMYRGLGSIGYTGAARVVHLVGINPIDASERVMVCTKNNLAPFPPSIAYEVKDGRFLWKGESKVTADSLLSPDSTDGGNTALDEAKDFLREALSMQPRRAAEVEREAEDAGISERTLKRAKKDIGTHTYRTGGRDGCWMWKLPTSAKDANIPIEEGLAPLESTGTNNLLSPLPF
ncbi:MAG: AAA family ATPase [Candidatus Peregrinibacteria bacterium]